MPTIQLVWGQEMPEMTWLRWVLPTSHCGYWAKDTWCRRHHLRSPCRPVRAMCNCNGNQGAFQRWGQDQAELLQTWILGTKNSGGFLRCRYCVLLSKITTHNHMGRGWKPSKLPSVKKTTGKKQQLKSTDHISKPIMPCHRNTQPGNSTASGGWTFRVFGP